MQQNNYTGGLDQNLENTDCQGEEEIISIKYIQ